MSRLILSLNGQTLAEYNMTKERYTVGRLADNDIRIDNVAVSGHHSLIINILNDSFLEDLNSTNGTYVNGKLIKKHALQHDDVITVGHHQLRFVEDQIDESTQDEFEKTMVIEPSAQVEQKVAAATAAAARAATPAVEQRPAAAQPARTYTPVPTSEPEPSYPAEPASGYEPAATETPAAARFESTPAHESTRAPEEATPGRQQAPKAPRQPQQPEPRHEARPQRQPEARAEAEPRREPDAQAEPQPRQEAPREPQPGPRAEPASTRTAASAAAEPEPTHVATQNIDQEQAVSLPLAKLQVLSGMFAGKELELKKALTTLGRPGIQVAAITRRAEGYYIVHVESGKPGDYPLVNGMSIGPQARTLQDNDVIQLAGVKMGFFLN